MTIIYTKYIISMGCYSQIDGQSNVVFTISWSLTGIDEAYKDIIYCNTDVPYIAGQPFIPYADLTQEQVFAWIDEYTSSEQMDQWKQQIADNIAKQKEIVYPTLPWQPPLL
jgi:hypothetical protein